MVELILVRHGRASANVASADAYSDEQEVIDVACRGTPTFLCRRQVSSSHGRLGRRPAGAAGTARRGVVLAVRAGAADGGGSRGTLPASSCRSRLDERLRDRELGVLDRLTMRGIRARYPDEAERRRWLGKFYHRPARWRVLG
jgi:broad specificity phosphatase PhoE